MSTTINLTLSELQFFLNHLSLPAKTQLRIIVDDDNTALKIQKRNLAIATMKKLRGSGNGNLVNALLRKREKDK